MKNRHASFADDAMKSQSLKADVLGTNTGHSPGIGILKSAASQKKDVSPKKQKVVGHVKNDYESNEKFLKIADNYQDTLRSQVESSRIGSWRIGSTTKSM